MLYQVIALAGAVVILYAYGASQLEKMARDSFAYQFLNLIGGIALTITAVNQLQYGFILLEGAWTVLSLWGLMKVKKAAA